MDMILCLTLFYFSNKLNVRRLYAIGSAVIFQPIRIKKPSLFRAFIQNRIGNCVLPIEIKV